MKKPLLVFVESDNVFMFFSYLIVGSSFYYFRSFYLDVGIYIVLFALLPTLSYTHSDLSIRKHFISRTKSQIDFDQSYFKKSKKKEWRIKDGYSQKNINIFLINRFVRNLINWCLVICLLISLVLLIISGYNYLISFIN